MERYEAKLSIPFLDVLRARLGMVLYFAIAGVALLWTFIRLLKGGFRDRVMLSNVVATGGIVAGVGSFLTPLSEISHRFWYYGEVLSSAFVGSLFVHFIKSRNKKLKKILSVGGIIFIALLSLLMFKANMSNDDNPLVPYYTQRTGWHDSELEAGKFIIFREGNIPFASDWDYSANLRYLKTNLISSGVLEDISRVTPRTFEEVKNCNCIFVFRKDLLENRLFYLGGRWTQTPHLPMKHLTIIKELSTHEVIIYNNENIIMILVKEGK